MILGALDDAGGQAYLMRQAEENPTAFLTLIGKVCLRRFRVIRNPLKVFTQVAYVIVDPKEPDSAE